MKGYGVFWIDSRDGEYILMDCQEKRDMAKTKLVKWQIESKVRKVDWKFVILPCEITYKLPNSKKK